ncbi:chaperone modulator CbpM [Kaistella sp.]|uniref:chaperone modulator CbpM n=1 Tax=Kaistella sp. TaxID=2782235 RepID=UPI0035A0786E
MNERISREELVRIYNVEITFFDSLEEAGLLKTETENNIKYLMFDELSTFEKFTNWHYDLEVNLAGLEVIKHLLDQLERLREENLTLR